MHENKEDKQKIKAKQSGQLDRVSDEWLSVQAKNLAKAP